MPEIQTRPTRERSRPGGPFMVEVRDLSGEWSAVHPWRLADALQSAACPRCCAQRLAVCHHSARANGEGADEEDREALRRYDEGE